MSHFNDYEADQSRLYNIDHHEDIDSAESKAKVKDIWKITGILTIITIVEVVGGLFLSETANAADMRWLLNTGFILLTVLKAFFIVSNFMHLGHENKGMRMAVYIPLTLFIWFIIAFLADGSFWLWISSTLGYSSAM